MGGRSNEIRILIGPNLRPYLNEGFAVVNSTPFIWASLSRLLIKDISATFEVLYLPLFVVT
jgi:hypothetical protein